MQQDTIYIQKVEHAIEQLKQGKLIIVVDDDDREAEGDLIGLGEFVDQEMINFMVTEARGLVCVPLSKELANKFKLHPMVEKNTDNHQTAFTVSIDHIDTTTGISAAERAFSIKKLLDEQAVASDFRRPGHIFPLIAKDGGVIVRNGHTEAAIDLARIAGSKPVGVICEIMNKDGTMARRKELLTFAKLHNLDMISVQDLIDYRYMKDHTIVKSETIVNLPTKTANFKLHAYSSIIDNDIQSVITSENFDPTKPVLTRIHSECFTGDVLGSLRCDCNEQLNKSMQLIADKNGMIIYLKQEGRGIGLLNKLKAYKLQEDGLDTIEANQALGLPIDARHYGIVASILNDLKVTQIKLISNNPEKINSVSHYGIEVLERIALTSTVNPHNKFYLETKKDKANHFINF